MSRWVNEGKPSTKQMLHLLSCQAVLWHFASAWYEKGHVSLWRLITLMYFRADSCVCEREREQGYSSTVSSYQWFWRVDADGLSWSRGRMWRANWRPVKPALFWSGRRWNRHHTIRRPPHHEVGRWHHGRETKAQFCVSIRALLL